MSGAGHRKCGSQRLCRQPAAAFAALLCLSLAWRTLAQVLTAQQTALLLLKANIDTKGTVLTNWLPTTDPCSGWLGVTCTDGSVTGMCAALDLCATRRLWLWLFPCGNGVSGLLRTACARLLHLATLRRGWALRR
jgi:hypothetical protein